MVQTGMLSPWSLALFDPKELQLIQSFLRQNHRLARTRDVWGLFDCDGEGKVNSYDTGSQEGSRPEQFWHIKFMSLDKSFWTEAVWRAAARKVDMLCTGFCSVTAASTDCTLDLAKYLAGELEQVSSYLPNRICSLGSGALHSESLEAKHHLFWHNKFLCVSWGFAHHWLKSLASSQEGVEVRRHLPTCPLFDGIPVKKQGCWEFELMI